MDDVIKEDAHTDQFLIKKNFGIIHDLTIKQETIFNHIVKSMNQQALYERCHNDLTKIDKSISDLKSLIDRYSLECDDYSSADSWRMVRHDLRTKVGSISGYAEIILEDLGPIQDELMAQLNQIIDMAQVILSCIENIKIEEKTDEIVLSPDEDKSFHILNDALEQSIIMIIDDSNDKRNLIKRRLKDDHHKIIEVSSAEDALQEMTQTTVDLILLDLILPKMSGYDLLLILKKQPHTCDIPILITSSLNEMESVVQCIRAGAEDYLPMPTDKTLLLARVSASLAKKKLLDQGRHYQQEILQMQKCLEAALQSVTDGFVIYDRNDRIYMCNQPFQQLYPSVKNLDTAANASKITYTEFLKINYDSNWYCNLHEHGYVRRSSDEFPEWAQIRLEKHNKPSQPYLEQLRDGRWIEISEQLIPEGGIVAIHSDVTPRIEREQEYQYIASHDRLTGLHNRSYFEKFLLNKIDQAGDSNFAILFFDLDGFKSVNDHFGHEHGDYLLKKVSRKLTDSLRITDVLARLGGDEFCALIDKYHNVEELKLLALRCAKAVGNSIEYEGKCMNFGISIGISCYPTHGRTPEALLARADAAMYVAKKSGKNNYHFA